MGSGSCPSRRRRNSTNFDMDCDGTKQGYDLELTRAVSEAVEVPVIASGGVGHPSHMVDGV